MVVIIHLLSTMDIPVGKIVFVLCGSFAICAHRAFWQLWAQRLSPVEASYYCWSLGRFQSCNTCKKLDLYDQQVLEMICLRNPRLPNTLFSEIFGPPKPYPKDLGEHIEFEAYFPVHLVVNLVAIGGPLALMLLGAMAIADAPPAALLGVEARWLLCEVKRR